MTELARRPRKHWPRYLAGISLAFAACSGAVTSDGSAAAPAATESTTEVVDPQSDIGADEWTTFGLDVGRRAVDADGPTALGPVLDEPKLLWQFPTGGVVESPLRSSTAPSMSARSMSNSSPSMR